MEDKSSRGREIVIPSTDSHFLTISKNRIDVFRVERLPQHVESDSCPVDDKTTDKEIDLRNVAGWVYPGIEIAEWSPLGSLLGVGTNDESLLIIDPMQEFKEVAKIKTGLVKKMYFSPRETYLVVMTPFVPVVNEDNVKVYRVSDQCIITTFGMKALAAQEKWPPLVWSNNETYCFRMATNEVQVFPSDIANFPTPSARVPAEKIKAFAPSIELQDGSIRIAVFIPSIKDKPASIKVFSLGFTTATPISLNTKSFFQVQDISFQWNHLGTAVLAIGHADVDVSGKSYYGTSTLHYIEANGQSSQIVGSPVSDCQWSPTSNEFIAINGPMPPTVNLYDGRTADPKLTFGQARRNTIRFNPFGRFIVVAGFGNLAGDFDIWDKNKKKIIGSGKAPCSVECDWAPDGRMFLCATTSPRMRVDNCIKIFRYNGDLLTKVDIPDLYFVKWLPCAPGTHQDRGTSRGRTIAKAAQPTEAPKVYRPPRATEEFDERMRAQKRDEVQTTATVIKSPSNLPVGAEYIQPPTTKSAKKNAARKAKKHKEKILDFPE